MIGYQKVLLAIASSFLLTNCGDSKSASAEATIPLATISPAVEDNIEIEKQREDNQGSDDPKLPSFTASCEEKEEKSSESEDPIIIKTCTYGDYRTISTGSPDYKGRYNYENGLYRLDKGGYKEIANSELFNQKQGDLLKQVNQRIKADYLELTRNPENKECFEGVKPIRDFKMDELRVSFESDLLVFHVEFGLPSACLSVDRTSVSFTLQEVEPYLNK